MIREIKKIVKSNRITNTIGLWVWKKYEPIRKNLIRKKMLNVLRALPNNVDGTQKFIVVQVFSREAGWFGYVNEFLVPVVLYLSRKGYRPIVDMQTYDSYYSLSSKENIWEMFYEQPGGSLLADVFKTKYFKSIKILAAGPELVGWHSAQIFDNKEYMKEYCECWDKYLKLRPEIEEEIQVLWKKMVKPEDEGRVLGASIRGTDFYLNPRGHFVQPSAEDAISVVDKKMAEWGCTKVFISTEDADIFNKFKEHFGEKLLYIEEERTLDPTKLYTLDRRKDDKYYSVKEYIFSKRLVSMCDYIVGGKTGGTRAAIGMNNRHFKGIYVYDYGSFI